MPRTLHDLVRRRPELEPLLPDIRVALGFLRDCVVSGGKILVCGNGGSAADSEHIVGELLKGFMLKRTLTKEQELNIAKLFPGEEQAISGNLQQAIPAVSLVSHSAIMTAVANDTNPEYVFAQQVYGLGRPGDALIAISTSGNSKNVINAAKIARVKGMKIVALTGRSGGNLKNFSDTTLRVPADTVYEIQELHLPLYHALCMALEEDLFTPDINASSKFGMSD